MGEDVQKEKLCDVDLDLTAAVEAYELIENDYRIEWIMDNLPGATPFVIKTNNGGVREQKYYSRGFALGNIVKDATHAGEDTQRPDQTFLHNHFTMIIRYRQADEQADGTNGKVIVGFEVYPKSISNTPADRDERGLPKNIEKPEAGFELNMPDINRKARNKAGYKFTVPYTYSVIFKEDNTVTWGNRWDRFMAPQDKAHGIHWLAIINSLVISGLLAVVVAVIFTRTIKGDIKGRGDGALDDGRSSKINGRGGLLDPMDRRSKEEIEASDDVDDVTGWKLLHSDVFRSPVHRNPLAALVGVGVQLVFMASGLLVLGCIGFLSPSMRGGFASVGMGLFILGGAFAGYAAGRTYKTLGGERWKVNTLMTAGLVPGLVFGTVFLLNLLAWSQASSTALPFTTLLAIFALWIVFQLPLVYIGAYVGFVRHGSYAVPIRPNAIPRQIPAKPWWTGSYASLLLSGIIPFVAVFIELMAMFKSVWQDKSSYYYLFGFATCVFLILVITIIELSIVTTYFLLCHEVRPRPSLHLSPANPPARTTAGTGPPSPPAPPPPSGSSSIACTTTSPACTCTASPPPSSSSPTAPLAAPSTASSWARSASSPPGRSSAASTRPSSLLWFSDILLTASQRHQSRLGRAGMHGSISARRLGAWAGKRVHIHLQWERRWKAMSSWRPCPCSALCSHLDLRVSSTEPDRLEPRPVALPPFPRPTHSTPHPRPLTRTATSTLPLLMKADAEAEDATRAQVGAREAPVPELYGQRLRVDEEGAALIKSMHGTPRRRRRVTRDICTAYGMILLQRRETRASRGRWSSPPVPAPQRTLESAKG